MKFLNPNEYQIKATRLFEKLKQKIELALPQSKIEHIGSSSITNAISKGDLDIFVGVNQDRLNDSIIKIEALGFKVKKDTLKNEFLCMLESFEFEINTAIQIVALGSKHEDFLTFRDQLNNNPKLVIEYNQLKLDSIKLDEQQYRDKKSKFILSVLEKLR